MLSGFTFLGLAGVSLVLIGIVLLAILIFEIAMFISVITNKHISDNAKILWIVGMLLVHPFIAIGYYFTDYKKS